MSKKVHFAEGNVQHHNAIRDAIAKREVKRTVPRQRRRRGIKSYDIEQEIERRRKLTARRTSVSPETYIERNFTGLDRKGRVEKPNQYAHVEAIRQQRIGRAHDGKREAAFAVNWSAPGIPTAHSLARLGLMIRTSDIRRHTRPL
jgi:hypothetical protein